ncbi:hypothetical protein P5673_023265 [Acropora cervicornis]|uniref:Uncharacterized protein n=1 Tax=Acropora cervicornis TaxID=6130 RepID=A0AAD9Q6L7_ACRCE|nr:hypothetical protein P5673_023265 [Acropora cervicornis]
MERDANGNKTMYEFVNKNNLQRLNWPSKFIIKAQIVPTLYYPTYPSQYLATVWIIKLADSLEQIKRHYYIYEKCVMNVGHDYLIQKCFHNKSIKKEVAEVLVLTLVNRRHALFVCSKGLLILPHGHSVAAFGYRDANISFCAGRYSMYGTVICSEGLFVGSSFNNEAMK